MLRFIWNKQHHQVSVERLERQKHLFNYSPTLQHGFPSRPSALAYDDSLCLLAIGTKTGQINVYGRPGVEFYGQHDNSESAVRNIIFLPHQGRLITHCDDNSLHLWQAEFDSTCDNNVAASGDRYATGAYMRHIASLTLDGKLKTISACCLELSGDNLLVGTEGGNIYIVSVAKFQLTESVIYQDVVMQNVPDDYKVNPGAVECMRPHPSHVDKLLIGYQRGLMVVFDRRHLNAERVGIWHRQLLRAGQTYVCNQSLECVSWSHDGSQFMSAHNDGSFIVWNARQLSKPDGPHTPYGPFPCKTINRLRWITTPNDGDWVVFCGGMPRASYGDKHTVSVMRRCAAGRELNHVAFDFTSAVVDFALLLDNGSEAGAAADTGSPHTLLVLAEEELVAVDLSSPGWPLHRLPHLSSVHSSAVTCSHYVSRCCRAVRRRLAVAAQAITTSASAGGAGRRHRRPFSTKPWPITGGVVGSQCQAPPIIAAGDQSDGDDDVIEDCDLLLTGHEDGSVRVWTASAQSFQLITMISTARLFSNDDEDEDEMDGHADSLEEDEEFPPLRAVGVFDPYSDDPRLAVKRLEFCGRSGHLLVAGTAGQLTLWTLPAASSYSPHPAVFLPHASTSGNNSSGDAGDSVQPRLYTVQPVELDLVSGQDSFVWKGHERLPARRQPLHLPLSCSSSTAVVVAVGFQPATVLQLSPPAAVSALCLQSSWGMFAAGTGHGFLLFDFEQNKVVMHKCTLNPHDYAASGESPMTRGKSLKKSLRESFRRLRKGRSQRFAGRATTGGVSSVAGRATTKQTAGGGRGGVRATATSPAYKETVGGERAVEARTEDAAYSGMVRTLYLATSYLANNQPSMKTMWAGTNSGAIFVYAVHCAGDGGDRRRAADSVSCQPGKEFRLKHGAPVLDIQIVDSLGSPVVVENSGQDDVEGHQEHPAPHRVVITSEEQFKVFTLPTMRPFGKFKLTAIEGSRIRRIGYGRFMEPTNSSAGRSYSEWCVMCGTNQGELMVLSLPELQRHVHQHCLRSDDIHGITSMVFTSRGEALYPLSSTVYQRVNISAAISQLPNCHLLLPASAREWYPASSSTTVSPSTNVQDCANDVAALSVKEGCNSGQSVGVHAATAADTTIDSHRDFINGASSGCDVSPGSISAGGCARGGATSPGAGASGAQNTTEVVEISSQQADRLMNSIKEIVNGHACDTAEKSVESYSECRDGVQSSVHKTSESQLTDARRNCDGTLTTQHTQSECVVRTNESSEPVSAVTTDGNVTTHTRQQMKVVRTTRITASPASSSAVAAGAEDTPAATTAGNGE